MTVCTKGVLWKESRDPPVTSPDLKLVRRPIHSYRHSSEARYLSNQTVGHSQTGVSLIDRSDLERLARLINQHDTQLPELDLLDVCYEGQQPLSYDRVTRGSRPPDAGQDGGPTPRCADAQAFDAGSPGRGDASPDHDATAAPRPG